MLSSFTMVGQSEIDGNKLWRNESYQRKEPINLFSVNIVCTYLSYTGIWPECHSILLDTKRYGVGKS
jgi:hypothetical protein